MTITKIHSRLYQHNSSRNRRQVYLTALHPMTGLPFNKAWVAPEGMDDSAARDWAKSRMEEILAEMRTTTPAPAVTDTIAEDGIFNPQTRTELPPISLIERANGAGPAPVLEAPVVPSKPLPMPAPTITPDGMIGQIELMCGLQLRHVRTPHDPIGHIEFDLADLSKLTVLCMYKAEADRVARERALAAAQAEIAADRARFLDVSAFTSTMPDLPVAQGAYIPISKQAPSAAARAKTMSAGLKAANTARIKRFAKGGKGPSQADKSMLLKLVEFLSELGDQVTADDLIESILPVGISTEAAEAILDYLARSRVISKVGLGEAARFYSIGKSSVTALNELLGL